MSLIVEDKTGLPNSNSYVSLTYANDYFTARQISEWTDLSDVEKEANLILATEYIDTIYWNSFLGEKLNEDQALLFPRVIDGVTEYPKRLEDATCQLALKSIDGALLEDTDKRVIK